MKLGPYLIAHIKISSKCVKDPNITAKTLNFLEEKIKEKLHYIGFSNDSLYMIPKAKTTKIKIYKSDYIQNLKLLCKEYNQQSENSTYEMGKHVCKAYI